MKKSNELPKIFIDGPTNEDWIKFHGQEEDIKAHEIAEQLHSSETTGESPDQNLSSKGRS